jgi:predicted ATP-dependent protease
MDLKELLGEQYEAVIAAAKEKGVSLLVNEKGKEEWFPKDRYNEILKQKGELESKISQNEKDIEELKKASGTSEELKKTIEKLENENKEWNQKYSDTQMEAAIKLAALQEQVNDPDDLSKFIDREKVKLSDGKVIGLDEQMKALKESKPYLFKSEEGKNPNQPGNDKKLPPAPGDEKMRLEVFGGLGIAPPPQQK